MKTKYNTSIQIYRNIHIRLIEYTPEHFARLKAKRFLLINPKSKENPSQNVWIPNAYLQDNGTLKPYINIDFVFRTAALQRKFKYAGITIPAWLHEQLNR